MRIDQLVLYGPRDDDRVRFDHGVTVFAGLGAQERRDLIETVVDALTGRLSNASVVYLDREGQKIFADRTGASYASTGTPAPAPSDVLGKDPATVTTLLTLTADDLGLGQRASASELQAELATARADLERIRTEHRELVQRADLVATWKQELADLSARIDRADEDAARWAWTELRRRTDEVRAERDMVDDADRGRTDRRILEAVDALRSTGEVWADLAAAASDLRAELGALPPVSPEDLARVAATPAELPADLATRLEGWQAAADLRRTADAELAQCHAPVPAPDDPLVADLAARDQELLWPAHARLEQANDTYARLSESLTRTELAPEVEDRIEQAHLEVVRCQREVERRFRPGALGAGTLAVGALLAGQSTSVAIAAVMLVAAVAMATWLLVLPRRTLAAATAAEEEALTGADAGSWLGLHLRRLDAVTDVADRKRFEAAANARATAQVEWDEVAGPHSPDALASRVDAVRAYAEATDPKAVARRTEKATAFSQAAREAEAAARASLAEGLEPYGVVAGAADLDPQQLATVLDQRVQAGAVARRAKKLAQLEQREAEAARKLGDVLSHLGYEEGDLETRLERAIAAVSAARHRQEAGVRGTPDIEREVAALEQELHATARPGWAEDVAPAGPPTDPNLLEARRREVGELVAAAGTPDLVGAERSLDVCQTRVATLESRLDELADGPGSLHEQLRARVGRTAVVGAGEEPVPVLVDDALRSVPVAEKLELLDLVVGLSRRAQVVMLTDDPVVARWARDRATGTDVTLYEAQPEPLTAAPQDPATGARPARLPALS